MLQTIGVRSNTAGGLTAWLQAIRAKSELRAAFQETWRSINQTGNERGPPAPPQSRSHVTDPGGGPK